MMTPSQNDGKRQEQAKTPRIGMRRTIGSRHLSTAIALIVLVSLSAWTHAEEADSMVSLAKWSIPAASAVELGQGIQARRVESAPGTPITLTFNLGPDLSEGPYKQLEYSTQQWYESTFWTGPDWTRVGDRWHHPGELTPSIRRFAVPRDGKVTITGPVFKLHLSGDGIRATIQHNDRVAWSAEIEGKDAEGIDPRLSLTVRQGDCIRFVVHKRGAISCDTTGWDPIITFDDGQAFQASKSFGKQQGAGNWFYEMEAAAATPKADPRLLAVDSDFVLHRFRVEEILEPLSSRRWLPFFVLTDGHDQSCLPFLVTSQGGWSMRPTFDDTQVLSLKIESDGAGQGATCLFSPRVGRSTTGLELLRGKPQGTDVVAWRQILVTWQLAVGYAKPAPEPDLLLAVQDDWAHRDAIDGHNRNLSSSDQQPLEPHQ